MPAGCEGFPTDVCEPLSRLTDAALAAQRLCRSHGLLAPMVGHVGDANFHMLLLVDPGSPGELERARQCADEMVRMAQVRLGGWRSG